MVSEERAGEIKTLISTLRRWAQGRPDVVAAGLAGSWAPGGVRMDSDVDVVVLTEDRALYLEDETWMYEVGGVGLDAEGGTVTERRFALPSGLEVELGVARPSWAATDPVDEGTRQVVADGMSVLYDPEGALARLPDAYGRSEATEGFLSSGVDHA